jgi:putative transcriptional regulator
MVDKFNKTETSIMKGLHEVLAHAEGKKSGVKRHKVKIPTINVKKAREKLGLSQDKFADAFGVSASTIRNWEQNRRTPQGAAKVLLNVIYTNPEAVIHALEHPIA